MLVLTRQVNEAIIIGDQIEVVVIDVKGGKVRLGIQAPSTVTIHRKEVYLAVKQANVEAAQAPPQSIDELRKLLDEKGKKDPRPPGSPA